MRSKISDMAGSGFFVKPEIIHSHWEQDYTVDDYLNYLSTGQLFADTEKSLCREELEQLAEKSNGIITRQYTCELYLAQKR